LAAALDASRAALDDADFTTAWSEGATMTLEEAATSVIENRAT